MLFIHLADTFIQSDVIEITGHIQPLLLIPKLSGNKGDLLQKSQTCMVSVGSRVVPFNKAWNVHRHE